MIDFSSATGHRVLLLTAVSFNRVHGGGITLSNLFQDWPRDRLAMAHFDEHEPETEICNEYFRLSGREIRRLGPLLPMRSSVAPEQSANVAPSLPSSPSSLKRLVFGKMLPDNGRLSPELTTWIERFKPTVLYTILGSNAVMDLVLAIRERYSPKLVIHFMDDWPSLAYSGGALSFIGQRRMGRLLRDVVDHASLRLGISPAMCDEYGARFGKPFVPFMNGVDVASYDEQPRPVERSKEILYVGSILETAQLQSLIDASRAAALLQDRGVRLTILTTHAHLARYRGALAIAPNITVATAPPDGAEFIARLKCAGALLLPVNFDRDSVTFIRYSMPTKVPAYLASGTPILAYGPSGVAQIVDARREGWAHLVTERNVASLSDAMLRIVSDDELRHTLEARALDVARRRHDLPHVRSQFQAAIAALG